MNNKTKADRSRLSSDDESQQSLGLVANCRYPSGRRAVGAFLEIGKYVVAIWKSRRSLLDANAH
jgi:hypothetical protein